MRLVTIPGIGYQQENIQTPVPNADAGTLNVRADVAGAGAGWESVARAGNEIAAAAERIKRQEDLTAVLKAKNESSIEINQGLIDYAPKMTGNLAQDQAEWDKIAAKIGQKHMAALGNRSTWRASATRCANRLLQKISTRCTRQASSMSRT